MTSVHTIQPTRGRTIGNCGGCGERALLVPSRDGRGRCFTCDEESFTSLERARIVELLLEVAPACLHRTGPATEMELDEVLAFVTEFPNENSEQPMTREERLEDARQWIASLKGPRH